MDGRTTFIPWQYRTLHSIMQSGSQSRSTYTHIREVSRDEQISTLVLRKHYCLQRRYEIIYLVTAARALIALL